MGTSYANTGLIIGAIYLLTAFMYPLASWVSDRFDDRCGVAALGFVVAGAGYGGAELLSHSPLRVVAFAVIPMLSPIFLASFFCLPTRLLKGSPAAGGIGLINGIGALGAFFGSSIVGFLKQTTGTYGGAFLCLSALALVGALALFGLRGLAAFAPRPRGISAEASAVGTAS